MLHSNASLSSLCDFMQQYNHQVSSSGVGHHSVACVIVLILVIMSGVSILTSDYVGSN